MPDVTVSESKVFISYRRDDSSGSAGRLRDRIADFVGEENVFMDVDSLSFGLDFVDAIGDAVANCDVLLAVIGPNWARAEVNGRRRLEDPQDFVRVEIEAALNRDVRVVPVLVEGAAPPLHDELPPSMAPLVRRHALHLSHDKFRIETERLMQDLALVCADGSRTTNVSKPPDASQETGEGDVTHERVSVQGSTSTEPSASVLNHDPMMLQLLVTLEDQHLVAVDKNKWFETVTVDGEIVQKKMTLDETQKFVLDDRGTVVGGVLSFETTWTGKLRNVALEVGGVVVFRAPGLLAEMTPTLDATRPR